MDGRRERLDARGIAAFLAMTFGVTWAVEYALIAIGVSFHPLPDPAWAVAPIAAVMFAPAASALVTARWVTREGAGSLGLRLGSGRPYLYAALVIPAAFIAIYGLTWLLGLGEPDWELEGLVRALPPEARAEIEEKGPTTVIAAVFAGSLLLAPFVNSVAGLGEELGWRGFLLPKLMPLGRPRAYALLGVIWGLWHAPLILFAGFGYGHGRPVAGLFVFVALLVAFGVFMNELTLRHRSSILAGWIHGVFNSQAYGILPVVFFKTDPLLGGKTGLVAVVVVSVLAAVEVLRNRRPRPARASPAGP